MKSSMLYGGDLHSALDWLCLNLNDGASVCLHLRCHSCVALNEMYLKCSFVKQMSCQRASVTQCKKRARRASPNFNQLLSRTLRLLVPELQLITARSPPRFALKLNQVRKLTNLDLNGAVFHLGHREAGSCHCEGLDLEVCWAKQRRRGGGGRWRRNAKETQSWIGRKIWPRKSKRNHLLGLLS